jgi:hypothetical protein
VSEAGARWARRDAIDYESPSQEAEDDQRLQRMRASDALADLQRMRASDALAET